MDNERCSYLCPIHLERCVLPHYHKIHVCVCQNLLNCKATRQLEEACQEISRASKLKEAGDE